MKNNRRASQSMKLRRLATIVGLSLFMAAYAPGVRGETGYQAWLRYAPLEKASASKYEAFPTNVVVAGDSVVLQSAQQELIRGIQGMLDVRLRLGPNQGGRRAILL